ncbi:MAG: hypothetical protein AAGJ08_23820, partial [Cyanobacteria bacterium P01_H01_bin.35]
MRLLTLIGEGELINVVGAEFILMAIGFDDYHLIVLGRVDGEYYPSHLSFRTGRATFTASRLLDNLRLLAFCPCGYNRGMTHVLLKDS